MADRQARGGTHRTLIKATLTVVVIALVLRKANLRDLGARLGHMTVLGAATMAALMFGNVAVSALRWWRLLVRLGERVPYAPLFKDCLVGFMYNMFLPTSFGGDVVRALRARRRVSEGHGHRAWSTSMYERIAGLVVLATIGALGTALGLGTHSGVPEQVRWAAFAAVPLFVLAFFVASAPFRVIVHVLEKRLPAPALADVRGIIQDLEGPLAAPGPRLEALGWSLGTQTLGLAYAVVGTHLLDAPGHEVALIVGMPVVHVLSMLPITLGGHGLREGLMVGVLGALGVPTDVCFAIAALYLAGYLTLAVAGAVVALVER